MAITIGILLMAMLCGLLVIGSKNTEISELKRRMIEREVSILGYCQRFEQKQINRLGYSDESTLWYKLQEIAHPYPLFDLIPLEELRTQDVGIEALGRLILERKSSGGRWTQPRKILTYPPGTSFVETNSISLATEEKYMLTPSDLPN